MAMIRSCQITGTNYKGNKKNSATKMTPFLGTLNCGNNNIVDGNFIAGAKNDLENNPVGFWPWIASLGSYDDKKEWIHQCGATLVSDRHFLTAAHCAGNLK